MDFAPNAQEFQQRAQGFAFLGQAAAMPLTTITAWEILFERLAIKRDGSDKGVLLAVCGAGGVGSILAHTDKHFAQIIEAAAVDGKICQINAPNG